MSTVVELFYCSWFTSSVSLVRPWDVSADLVAIAWSVLVGWAVAKALGGLATV